MSISWEQGVIKLVTFVVLFFFKKKSKIWLFNSIDTTHTRKTEDVFWAVSQILHLDIGLNVDKGKKRPLA